MKLKRKGRLLSLVLCFCMLFSTILPVSSLAAERHIGTDSYMTETDVTSEPDSYMTETDVTSEPDSYMTETDVTSEPDSYMTETDVTSEPDSYMTEADITSEPDSYMTEADITSEPDSYMTEADITSEPDSYMTEADITSEPDSYMTEADITSEPDSYMTEADITSEPGSYSAENDTTEIDLANWVSTHDGDSITLHLFKSDGNGGYTDLTPGDDGAYHAIAGETYRLSLVIKDKNGLPTGTYYYKLPESDFTVASQTGSITTTSGDTFGSWHINQGGVKDNVLYIEINDNNHSDMDFTVACNVSFDNVGAEIQFGDFKIIVKDKEYNRDLYLYKAGDYMSSYTMEHGIFRWTFHVDGPIGGETLTDEVLVGNQWGETHPHKFTLSELYNSDGTDWDNTGTPHIKINAQDGSGYFWYQEIKFTPENEDTKTGYAITFPETVEVQNKNGEKKTVSLRENYIKWGFIIYTSPVNKDEAGRYVNSATIGNKTQTSATYYYPTTDSVKIVKGVKDGDGDNRYDWMVQATIPGKADGIDYVWRISDYISYYANWISSTQEGSRKTLDPQKVIDFDTIKITSGGQTVNPYTSPDGAQYIYILVNNNDKNEPRTFIYFATKANGGDKIITAEDAGLTGVTLPAGYTMLWTSKNDTTFEITYSTSKETYEELVKEHGNSNRQVFRNVASLQLGSVVDGKVPSFGGRCQDTESIRVEPVFTKNLSGVPNKDNTYVATFIMTVNGSKVDLGDDPLVLHDEMSESLTYLSGRMTITAEDRDGVERSLQTDEYSVGYDAASHKLTITIKEPQPVKYTLTYQAMIMDPATGMQYANSADVNITGKGYSANVIAHSLTDVTSDAKNFYFYFLKTDNTEEKNPLKGATYGLYEYEANEDGTDKLITTATTGDDGQVVFYTIANEVYLQESVIYYMKEITPPEGYQLNTERVYFIICASADEDHHTDCPVFAQAVANSDLPQNIKDNMEAIHSGQTLTQADAPEVIEKTSVTVEKKWEDNDDKYGKRPDKVTVQLYADGKAVDGKTAELSESNGWQFTFDELNKYQADRTTEIGYTVMETSSVPGYIASYSDDGLTVTNTLQKEEQNGNVTFKIQKYRTGTDIPVEGVVFDLKNGDEIVARAATGEDGVAVFTLTPEGENDYSLILSEESAPAGYTKTNDTWTVKLHRDETPEIVLNTDAEGNNIFRIIWHWSVSLFKGDAEDTDDSNGVLTVYNDYSASGTFTLTGTKNLTGKELTDNEYQFEVKENGSLVASGVSKADGTIAFSAISYTLDDIGEHTYTVSEAKGNAPEIVYDESVLTVKVIVSDNGDGTLSAVLADGTQPVVFDNQFERQMIPISGEKTWNDENDQDGKRPESITIRLYADGTEVASKTVTEADGWKWTFENQPKYADGTEIVYTITEDAVVGYASSVNGYNVTNSYTPGKVSISVVKAWEDNSNQDGIRPNDITVVLMKNGIATDTTLLLNAGNNWSGSFNDLDEYTAGAKNVYTVQEITVDGYNTVITGDMTTGYIITNTHAPATICIEGSKTWDDSNNQDGKRPDSITIHLFANGTEVDSKTVTADDNWSWKFDNQPEYANGAKIVYTITEDAVDGYTSEVNGYNVTNSYAPGKVSVSVVKSWNDSSNQDGIRPNDITVVLVKNGTATEQTITLSAGNNWSGSFSDLDEYTAGQKNFYTVQEITVDGYNTVITGDMATGYVITNSHTPATIAIEGSKTWNDADNQDGKRPEAITIRLYANGTEVASKSVTEADGWKWAFENQPKYADGAEIVYTITEDAVGGYTSEVNGYNVTNSYAPGKISISIVKAWKDSNNQDSIRPDSITAVLVKNGAETDTKLVLNAGNNWSGSFSNLDEYTAGEKNVYTVQEVSVDGYNAIITGDMETGYVITNSHNPKVPDTPDKPDTLDKPDTPDNPGKSSSPQTGDNSNLPLWFALMILSMAGLVGTLCASRKRKSE